MQLVRVPEGRIDEYLSDFFNNSELTFEGMDLENSTSKGFAEFEELVKGAGCCDDKELVAYIVSGKIMNQQFGLTDSNAYPDDLNLVVIPGVHNVEFRTNQSAHWFDDIVCNNRIKQNGVRYGVKPDFDCFDN